MIRGGRTYRIIADHLGSVRLVVDTETGDIVQRMKYSAFGQVILDTHPGFQPFGFAGGIYDHETGLTRFGARDYGSTIALWLDEDPIGFSGGDTNRYEYAMGDPINKIDVSGLDALVCLYPGAAGFGHVGVGVNSNSTFGFYPIPDQPGNLITGTPGEVKPDTRKPLRCKRVETNSAQDEAMSAFIEGSQMPPAGDYTFAAGNCVNFVQMTLDAGDVPAPDGIAPIPFFGALKGKAVNP